MNGRDKQVCTNYYIVNFPHFLERTSIQISLIFYLIKVVATLPCLIYNKVKENGINLFCKVVLSCSPIAVVTHQGEKCEDIRPMFSLAY